jgi:hypothetical protein
MCPATDIDPSPEADVSDSGGKSQGLRHRETRGQKQGI